MAPASHPAVSRDRLAHFRELRARLDPSGDPADAMVERYVEGPGSVSARFAAELSLAPSSSHLLIGGIGSGKTTQLLATQRRVSEVHDVRALYVDASKQHDIAKMVPGVIVAQVGLALAPLLDADRVGSFARRLRGIATGYRVPLESDPHGDKGPGENVPGLLVSPEQIAASVQEALLPLKGLLDVLQARSEHLVVMLDGLDRMTDMQAFEQIVIHDVKALSSAGVGVVLGGPLRALYGLVTTAIDTFGRKHLQGLRPAEIEVLQRVRTKGSFVQTSEDDLALLMTRRVLEYRNQNRLRYEVHPTIEKLLQELAEK